MQKISFLKIISFLALFNSLILNASFSNEKIPSEVRSWRVSLGYGLAFKKNIRKNNNYSGADSKILFNHIPLVQFGWGPISVGAQGISAGVFGNRDVSGFININRIGDRYYATGMENRKESWFFGAGIKYHKFTTLIARDINGRSKGIKGSIHYTATYPLGENSNTRSTLGVECYDKSFAQYYYGVKSTEVTSSRPEFHAKAYCLPTASFFPGYKITEEFTFLMGISLKGLTQSIRKSPTTDGSWLESALITGVTWKL